MNSECLILGPEGAGKTLLLKKLKRIISNGALAKESTVTNSQAQSAVNLSDTNVSEVLHTLPTAGTKLEQLHISKGIVCTLRECGGSTAPIWSSYYRDCHMVMFVIDSTNTTQIAAATMLLLDVLSAKDLEHKPVLVFFNKRDSDCRMSMIELKSIMRLSDILHHAVQPLQVVEGSCVAESGLDIVVEWIMKNLSN